MGDHGVCQPLVAISLFVDLMSTMSPKADVSQIHFFGECMTLVFTCPHDTDCVFANVFTGIGPALADSKSSCNR